MLTDLSKIRTDFEVDYRVDFGVNFEVNVGLFVLYFPFYKFLIKKKKITLNILKSRQFSSS